MNRREKKEFFELYDSVTTGVFGYKSTLINYCCSDVTILRRGVEDYIDLFVDVERVNTMLETCTLPIACLLAFRRNLTVSLFFIHYGYYRFGDIQNFSAIIWLVCESHDTNVYIHHAGNGKVQIIHGKIAQLDEKITCVYQFHGCVFHGCLDCFKDGDSTPGPLKKDEWVLGQRNLYQGDDYPPISELFGIVKIKFFPPHNLFFPVKFENKLKFPLCRSCMEERRNDFGNHENVEDRFSLAQKVKLAFKHGYIIFHMYEAWNYQKSKYDTNTKQGTESEKLDYIKMYKELEGIDLRMGNIKHHSG
ncbi:hypothetical protein B566_EDAN013506, partial [Ephemera danica]